MLLVNTLVKSSSIAGMGLFADEDIKQGQIVWRYESQTCSIFTHKQLDALLKSFHKTETSLIQYYLIYGYYVNHLDGIVVCLDNARFVNHADEPNCGSPSNVSREFTWQYSVAFRDIKKGEEITESYDSYDSSQWLDDWCQEYHIFHHLPVKTGT